MNRTGPRRPTPLLAAVLLLACGRDKEPTTVNSIREVGISITQAAVSLVVGDQSVIAARVSLSSGQTASASPVWTSSDVSVATVGSDGTLTAIAAGSTTVTATYRQFRASATVTVRSPGPPTVLLLSTTVLNLITGGAERLTARAFDSAGHATSASQVVWSSADAAVATVGATDGTVSANAAGTTLVTATLGALSATAAVSVSNLAASVTFARWTGLLDGTYTTDVLSFSPADRTARPLARAAAFAWVAGPAWSADGALLAVEVIHKFTWLPGEEGGADYTSDLYVVDAAAAAAAPWRALTTNGLSRAPTWSPDGKRIAYLQQVALFSPNNIYIVDAGGGEPVRLAYPREAWFGTPRWSPDGTRLVFSAYDERIGNSEIFVINADGSGLTNVSASPSEDAGPTWSPDGTRIAFVSTRASTPGKYDVSVYVMNPDGGNVKRLTSLPGYSSGPAWSPDGRQILFSMGGLYVMNADGSAVTRLTTPPNGMWDVSAAWRP